MPFAGTAGYSENTPIKQEHFTTIMRTVCGVVKGIIRRGGDAVLPHFVYIDLNAGPGWYGSPTLFGTGYHGSPIIALNAARYRNLSLVAYCMEHDHPTANALYTHLTSIMGLQSIRDPQIPPVVLMSADGLSVVKLWPFDSMLATQHIIDEIRQMKVAHEAQMVYGLVYSDTNGGDVPFDELARYSQAFRQVDLLIHLSATHRKRVNGRYGTRLPIVEALALVDKRYWIVRKPARREQWTFVLGTNWHSFPDFSRHGFVTIDSPEGRAILNTISYRREVDDE